jgi:RimJ/RimL family protein N-acetyltransferase
MIDDNAFEGSLVRLAGLTRDDLRTVVRWYQDAGYLRLYDARPAFPKSEAALQDWLTEADRDPCTFLFAIHLLEPNTVVGMLSIYSIEWAHRVAWISIGIGDRGYWGKGYGFDAMRIGLDFAYNELNLHRVQLTVFEYNTRAAALYERLGFKREGTFRESLERDGRRYDMHLYGLLRSEWAVEGTRG